MSGEFAAAGDIATGALIGRAVEPGAGEHSDGEAHGVCLNCGTALIGDFCHACGQNGHVHKTLRSIGHDLLHGVFHFEGKVWRTLPMLVTHPGGLTRRYIDGERARFVSPLAMFLFFVFLMFATFHSGGGEGTTNINLDPAARAALAKELEPQIAKTKAKRDAIDAQIAATKKAGQDTKQLRGKRDAIDDVLDRMETQRDTIGEFADGKGRVTLQKLDTGWPALDKGIKKANANPELALYKLQSSAYKYSWALIPISLPFVALLFLWRRRFKMYDHAIFITYSLSFMLLLATLCSELIAWSAPAWIIVFLALLVPPVHLFFQLKGAYQLRWYSALWRTVVLMNFAFITLTLFAFLLLGLGLME